VSDPTERRPTEIPPETILQGADGPDRHSWCYNLLQRRGYLVWHCFACSAKLHTAVGALSHLELVHGPLGPPTAP
jgi:hypothetical protein